MRALEVQVAGVLCCLGAAAIGCDFSAPEKRGHAALSVLSAHSPRPTPGGDPSCAPEECNGVDDDCDGVVDDGNPGGGASCGGYDASPCGIGGVMMCVDGQLICYGDAPPSGEVCDGVDNDCDSAIDEAGVCGPGK